MNKEEQAALDAGMKFLDCFAKRSVDGCMASFTTAKPFLLFGTNDNKVFTTAEEMRAAFTRGFASMANIRWEQRRNAHVIVAAVLASVIVELPVSYQSEGKDVKTLFRYALTLV